MTEKQKYYLWFALIISICMTILMEIFQLYTLPVLCILEPVSYTHLLAHET